MRKIKQRVLAIFLTVMMLFGMLPAVAAAESPAVTKSIVVTGVCGIDGQLSYDNAGVITSVGYAPVTEMSGGIENGHVVYTSEAPADLVINVTFVFSDDAPEGAACTVGFAYQVMDADGNWSDALYTSVSASAPSHPDNDGDEDKESANNEDAEDGKNDEDVVDEEILDEDLEDEDLADGENIESEDDEESSEDEDAEGSDEDEDPADDKEDAEDESDEDESDADEVDEDADDEENEDANGEEDEDSDTADDEDDEEDNDDADEADDLDESDSEDEDSDDNATEEDDKGDKSDDVDDNDDINDDELDDENEQNVDDDQDADDAEDEENVPENDDEEENEPIDEPDEDENVDDDDSDYGNVPDEDDSDEEEDEGSGTIGGEGEFVVGLSVDEEDHQCEVCEKYNSELPDDEFKQCFDCEGEHWYCEEHFDDHEHLDADGKPLVVQDPVEDDDPDEDDPPADDPPEDDPIDTPPEDDTGDELTDPSERPPVQPISSEDPGDTSEPSDDPDPTETGSIVKPPEDKPDPSEDEPTPGTDPGSIVQPPEGGPHPADPDKPASDTPVPSDPASHVGGGSTPIWTYTPPHNSEIQLFYVNPAIREQIHLDATLADIARHELEADDSKEEKLAPDVIKYNNWFYDVEDATSVYDYDERIEPHNWNTTFVVWCANQLSYIDFNRFPMTNDSVELFDWLCAVEENNLISINEALSTTDDVEVIAGDLVFLEKDDGYLVGIVTEIDVEEHTIKMIFGDHHRAVEEIELDMFELPSSTKFIHVYVPDYTLSAIASYLIRELEITPAAAAGILANIRCESNFNTQSIGDGGTSYGICQWHNGRWDNLVAYCNSEDISWATMEGQLMFLKHEMETNYEDMLQTFRECENNDESAYEAATMFSLRFERPAGQEASASVRGYLASRNMFPTIMRIVEEEEDVEEVNEDIEAAPVSKLALDNKMLLAMDETPASKKDEKTSAPVSSVVNASAQNILENKLNQNVYASVVYATSSSNGF